MSAGTKTALKLLTLGFPGPRADRRLDWRKRDGYATAGTERRTGNEIVCGC